MRPYETLWDANETEGFWLKKLVSGYFVSEKQIEFESLVVTRTTV